MACIHKQYNEQLGVEYCDCLNELYCKKEKCAFYQSTTRYKHGFLIESNGMKYHTIIDTQPWKTPPKVKCVKTSSGRNFQKI